jgi:hypothetical protein
MRKSPDIGSLFIFCLLFFISILPGCNNSSSNKDRSKEVAEGFLTDDSILFPDQLTEADKERFRKLLLADSTKAFSEDYIRIMELQRNLIDHYEYEGIRLVMGKTKDDKFYPIGRFPADCPWYGYNKLTPTELIDSNFQLLKDDIPAMLASMRERCGWIYAEKKEQGWELCYVLNSKLEDGKRYFTIYTGYPAKTGFPGLYLPEHWTLPPALKKFYAVHDGFDGDFVTGPWVLPSDKLRLIADEEHRQRLELPPNISSRDLLVVISFGSDFEDCFVREKGERTGNNMAEWDSDSRIVTSKKTDFFSLIDRYFSSPDEE